MNKLPLTKKQIVNLFKKQKVVIFNSEKVKLENSEDRFLYKNIKSKIIAVTNKPLPINNSITICIYFLSFVSYKYNIKIEDLQNDLTDEKAKTATLETQVADLLARVTALENP